MLSVLGPVTLARDDRPVALSCLERGLLAHAALTSPISVPTLEPWLWADAAPASATNRVQALVSGIRRKCGAGVSPLVTDGSTYRLSSHVRVDLLELRRLRDEAGRLETAGDPSCLDAFRRAADLCGDRPLGAIPDTALVEIEREQLQQTRLDLWEAYAAAALAQGRSETVLTDLALLTAAHPFREGLVAQYVLALAATGRQEQALRVYRSTHALLDRELAVAPSAQLREAHARVLGGGCGPAATGPGPRVDTTGASWRDAPPPRTQPRRPPGFAGRRDQLAALDRAARSCRNAAVTAQVTGLAGMGKSALAVEAAHRLRHHFPDGILYADAAQECGDTMVGAVLSTFLHVLGVQPAAVATPLADRVAQFRSVVDGRRVLIVLDAVDSGADSAPPHVTDLLPAAPGAMAIVTSRRPVDGLDPDLQLPVGRLDTASSLDLLRAAIGHDRVEADRAGAERLIEVVGGMPLALRLVARRASARPDLTLARAAEKIDQRATDGLDTLTAGVRLALGRLPGEAQEAVTLVAALPTRSFSGWTVGALLDDPDAGDRAVDALIASGLVEAVQRPGQIVQFRLHEVVARLVPGSGAPERSWSDAAPRLGRELLDRCISHGRTHPTQLLPRPGLPTPGPATPLDRSSCSVERAESLAFFATEAPLARALARRLVESRPDLAWRLLVSIASASLSTPSPERWSAAVAAVEPVLGPHDDGRRGSAHLMLCRAWHLQSRSSDSARARSLADQARRQLILLGEHGPAASAAIVAGSCSLSVGRREEAERNVAQAEDSLARHDDRLLVGMVAMLRGMIHHDYDELAAAVAELTRAREMLSPTPARAAFGHATLELSRALRRRGDLGPSDLLVDEALDVLDPTTHDHCYALDARAEVSVALGHGPVALRQAEQAWRRADQARDVFLVARTRRSRAGALRLLGRLDEAAQQLRTSIEELTRIGRPLSVAASLRELVDVLDLQGRHLEANEVHRQWSAAAHAAGVADRTEITSTATRFHR